jgi:hypothetical protein
LPLRILLEPVNNTPDSILTKVCAFVDKLKFKQIKRIQKRGWKISLETKWFILSVCFFGTVLFNVLQRLVKEALPSRRVVMIFTQLYGVLIFSNQGT